MKQSHYTSPRTLNDSTFITNCDPIEYGTRSFHTNDSIVMWGCGLSLIAFVVVLLINFS